MSQDSAWDIFYADNAPEVLDQVVSFVTPEKKTKLT
jgi:hypothetical protein